MRLNNKLEYDKTSGSSFLLIVLLSILLIYFLLVGVLGFVRLAREKIASIVEEICPTCDGVIKFIGGNEYDIKLNVDIETEIKNITLGGNVIKFEKYNESSSNSGSIHYLNDKSNINKGYDYIFDKNENRFNFNGEWFDLSEFKLKLLEVDNFEFSKDIEVLELNDLDICFRDMIIDLGNQNIVRTYNLKIKNYIYIISFVDNVVVIDTNIDPTAYYENELYSDKTMFVFEANGVEVLDLEISLFDKIKFIDLDGKMKRPNISVIEVDGYDLINNENKFNWFDENLEEDYTASLKISYVDLLGNEYEEKVVGLLFTQLSVPKFIDLNNYYEFKIGEYKTPMPTEVICSITQNNLIDSLIIDESMLNVNEVGSYRVIYSVESALSNIPQKKVVIINIVE